MSSQLRVPFGLTGDRLFEPLQVKNGKACGCVCPGCKRPLIAKQGSKTPHFAHEPGEDCNFGLETAVHLAAKQIIFDRQQVRLPAVLYQSPFPNGGLLGNDLMTTISLDSVVLEHWLGDMRPDIMVSKDGEDYLVEIAVTHFVDDSKQAKILARQTPTFEIDASSIKNELTFESLTDLLYSGYYFAKWLYHPRLAELAAQAQETHLAQEQEAHLARTAAHQVRLATTQAAQLAVQQLELHQFAKKRVERFEKLKKYRDLSAHQKLERNLRVLAINENQLERLTIFVPFENAFGVHRNVWQSAVLAYITRIERLEGREKTMRAGSHTGRCSDWLNEVFTVKTSVEHGDRIAVWKYFKHLEALGILQHLGHKDFSLKTSSQNWAKIS